MNGCAVTTAGQLLRNDSVLLSALMGVGANDRAVMGRKRTTEDEEPMHHTRGSRKLRNNSVLR